VFGRSISAAVASGLQRLAGCTSLITKAVTSAIPMSIRQCRFGFQFSDYLLPSCFFTNFPFGSTSNLDSFPFALTMTS
jgi:hypothetical protein